MHEEPLIVCLDVDYRDGGAMAAGLWFRGWTSPSSLHEATRFFSNPAPYEPGAFYRRELPCLLGVLERGPDPDIVVVDGYVELADGEPGLGAHLHKAIERPVIGVAKTRFSGAAAVEVRRGDSRDRSTSRPQACPPKTLHPESARCTARSVSHCS